MKWKSRDGVGSEVTLYSEEAVRERLNAESCVAAVEKAFRELGAKEVPAPGVLSLHAPTGAFHIKAALSGDYFVTKVNANYPGNPSRGLPTIQGVVALFESGNGRLLAIMDSAELTARRTGAATGVAVKYLASRGPLKVMLIGCGRQARSQLESVAAVRSIERVFLCDVNESAAQTLATDIGAQMQTEVVTVRDLHAFSRQSDVVITCTPSHDAFLHATSVRAGCLVAAVGADNPHKQELSPELLAKSTVVADVLEQCVVMGDLHHAIEAGVMTAQDVYGELGEIVCGQKPGRVAESDVIVFDSTGFALQDVAAAVLVYRSDQ
jgi:alanine dehydrogenase